MSGGRRLVIAPAIRSALAWLSFCEEIRSPMVGGDPAQEFAPGRDWTKRERVARDAALEFLAAYFSDAEVRVAVDATTLQVSTEMEAEVLFDWDSEDEEDSASDAEESSEG